MYTHSSFYPIHSYRPAHFFTYLSLQLHTQFRQFTPLPWFYFKRATHQSVEIFVIRVVHEPLSSQICRVSVHQQSHTTYASPSVGAA